MFCIKYIAAKWRTQQQAIFCCVGWVLLMPRKFWEAGQFTKAALSTARKNPPGARIFAVDLTRGMRREKRQAGSRAKKSAPREPRMRNPWSAQETENPRAGTTQRGGFHPRHGEVVDAAFAAERRGAPDFHGDDSTHRRECQYVQSNKTDRIRNGPIKRTDWRSV